MKLIESKAELVLQQEGLEGVYKQIEFCGRTCYKSEDKITEDSAKGFVERVIKSGHGAMLEHGTVYLFIKISAYDRTLIYHIQEYEKNPYSKVIYLGFDDNEETNFEDILRYPATGDMQYVVTTNYRVLVENGWLDDLKYLCEPTEYHERRITVHFVCDRGVSHELVRHRVFSFAQESTRYCNYSKDKFGKELTFMKPAWDTTLKPDQFGEDRSLPFFLSEAEALYNRLINNCGWTPQQARMILPNCLKTEICMTGFASDWRFFFDLRYYGETGKPHPDMELLASKARSEFMKAGLWDNIMACPTKFDKDDTEGKD